MWVTLARAAERTSRISLGPGVLVRSLRHVLVNAAAAATLAALAPGRVVLGVGFGLTSRLALGHRPLPWDPSPPTPARCGAFCAARTWSGRAR